MARTDAKGLALRSDCARALVEVQAHGRQAPAALQRLVFEGRAARDRAFAKDLVTGTLRWKGTLEALLAAMGTRSHLPFEDDWSLMVMLLALYQLLFMEKVPGYAAVDCAVELLKRRSGRKAAPFANAVLRRCAAAGSLEALIGDAAPGRRSQILWASYPPWLRRRLVDVYGETGAFDLAMAMNGRPPVTVRVDRMAPSEASAAILERFAGARVGPGRWHPSCLVVEKGGDLTRLDLHARGVLTVQDEGSQVVGHALGAGGDDRVLDTCCGMGIKTSQIGILLEGGRILALDRSPEKLRRLGKETARTGVKCVGAVCADATRPPLTPGSLFDRILVDAPCSGTGSLSRKPEIKLRLKPSDPQRLAGLQGDLLRGAAPHLREGGILLYTVCSVLPEEGPGVIEKFLQENRAFSIASIPRGPAGLTPSKDGTLLLLPSLHGTEGFYAAAITR
jgi:16S rRNA (cytosine967-C5)-methyltransferase